MRETWSGAFAISRDGRYLAYVQVDDPVRNDAALVVLDRRTNRATEIPLPLNGEVVKFDDTGRRIAVGTFDGRVVAIDRRAAKVAAISGVVSDGFLTDLLFTRFGLVAEGTDGRTTILDADTLRIAGVVDPVPGNSAGQLGIQDGHRVVISLPEASRPDSYLAVVAFDLRPQAWIDHACRLAGPDMPKSHWREVLPDREYVAPCTHA